MKKIQIKVSNLLTAMLSGVITLMGFGSCRHNQQAIIPTAPKSESIDQIRVMYGVPQGVYRISGTITDAGKKPIEGATITITNPDNPSTAETYKSAYNGEYFTPYTDPDGTEKLDIEVSAPGYETQKRSVKVMKLLADRSRRFDFRLKEAK